MQSEIVVQINYEGGPYLLNPRRLAAGQTVVFDLRKIRDQQIPDNKGHTIPLSVTGGQFKWFIHGAGSGRLIGRAEMLSLSHGISSSYSCAGGGCPPVFAYGFLDPSSVTLDPGDETTVNAFEVDYDSNYNPVGPFSPDVDSWDDTDPFAVYLAANGSSAQLIGISGGTAYIWANIRYEQYAWDGLECVDGGPNDGATDYGQANVIQVNSISPNKGLIGQPINVTITGAGFVAGSTVNIDSGIVQNVTIQSSTTITANYTSNDNAAGGNHRVTVTSNGKTSTDNVNFYVQIPTSLSVLGIATIPSTGVPAEAPCKAGQDFGIMVAVSYSVLDQQSQAIASSDMEPQETITNLIFQGQPRGDPRPSFGDLGPTWYQGTSQFTDSNGFFLDAPVGFCSNGSMTSQFTQTIRIVPLNQNTYVVRTQTFAFTSSSEGHGTIDNGSDILKTR